MDRNALPLKKKIESKYTGELPPRNKWRVLVIQNKTESQTGSQVVSCKVNV